MKCSPARLAANRANSLKSTGPKTQKGKEIARANSLKHGLTGVGVVLPGEDKEAIERRCQKLVDEFEPRTEREIILVERAAFLSIRLLRCQRHDNAMLSIRVRHAVEDFHKSRLDGLNQAVARLEREPGPTVTLLKRDPDGLDWLVEQWQTLREQLTEGDGWAFRVTQAFLMVNLMGREGSTADKPREVKLHEAFKGHFGNLDPADRQAVPDEAKPEWARAQLLAMIDRELDDLKAAIEAFDITDLKADQDEARDRVLFDPSNDATLARRYEAATERSLKKTFRELDELALFDPEETEEIIPEIPAEPEVASKGRGTLASSCQIKEIPPEADEEEPVALTTEDLIALTGRPNAEKDVIPTRIE